MYYRTRDLAARWGVSERTIRRWLARGIPGSLRPLRYTQLGRALAWSESQVEQAEQELARVGRSPLSRRRSA